MLLMPLTWVLPSVLLEAVGAFLCGGACGFRGFSYRSLRAGLYLA